MASTRSYSAATERVGSSSVAQLEANPIADTRLGRVLAGGGDRRLVEVVAVDLHIREGGGDGDRAMPSPQPISAIAQGARPPRRRA